MFDDNIRHLGRLGLRDAMRLFGLTARALRYYEEIELIEVARDRQNYRYYDAAARKRLAWITPLRAAGVPIEDIREVLDAVDNDGGGRELAVAKLQARRSAICRELTGVEAAIAEFGGREEAKAAPYRARSVKSAGGALAAVLND